VIVGAGGAAGDAGTSSSPSSSGGAGGAVCPLAAVAHEKATAKGSAEERETLDLSKGSSEKE
jgi:hypothetical protein